MTFIWKHKNNSLIYWLFLYSNLKDKFNLIDVTNSLPQSKKKGVASSKSEETKEELVEKVEINQETSEDLLIDLFNRELGFSRVVEEMIKAQKPLKMLNRNWIIYQYNWEKLL